MIATHLPLLQTLFPEGERLSSAVGKVDDAAWNNRPAIVDADKNPAAVA